MSNIFIKFFQDSIAHMYQMHSSSIQMRSYYELITLSLSCIFLQAETILEVKKIKLNDVS